MEKKGYLLLEDGTIFEGVLRGAQKSAVAELVFTTSVVGYMDTLTDPAYAGQMVVQTFPCIGCYGVVPAEGKPQLSGYVCRDICDTPSNFRCEGKLNDYLAENGVTCLTDVDTRAITRALRSRGTMNAAILTELPEDIAAETAKLKAHVPAADVSAVSCKEIQPAATKGLHHVVLWDFGAKGDTQAELEKRGCAVTCVPAHTTAAEIVRLNPDGVLLSNGPGNPNDNTAIISEIRALCEETLPMMGICLGHQLLALSQGASVVKLPYGHRGGNQPIRDVKTGQSYISSQNHGFAVDAQTLPSGAFLRFINTNDGTCEGVEYPELQAFSVQFQPQACGGPQDTRYLYDRFIAMMGGNKECR